MEVGQIEVGDVVDWWWGANATERADLCVQLGGFIGDAVLTDPPEYVIDFVMQNPEVIGL